MPTIFSHPAPVLALSAALGLRRVPSRLLLFGALCAALPDADVLGFRLGVGYADALGHRGFFHSLAFALIVGAAGAGMAPLLRCRRLAGFAAGFFAVGSHIALDALTNGGLGVAAFWPFDQERHFFPWRPIQVAPLRPRAFLSQRGLAVLASELRWVWLPCAVAGAVLWLARRSWERRGPVWRGQPLRPR